MLFRSTRMKSLVMVGLSAAAIALSSPAFAGACSGSLSGLISAGSCTDGNLVFSNFAYSPDGSNGGMTPTAANITVVPAPNALQFDSFWDAPTSGSVSDAGLQLTVSTNDGSLITDKDRKSTRLNSSHLKLSRMPSSA